MAFLRDDQVYELTLIQDPTRRRMEKSGFFPKRIRITPRRVAWRQSEVDDWISNPEDWGQRQRNKAKKTCHDDLAEDL